MLPNHIQYAVSSIKLGAACSNIKVWDDDDCEDTSTDNVVFTGDVSKLPADLHNDVCKITLSARVPLSSNECVVSLYEDADYEGTLLGTYTLNITASSPEVILLLSESQGDEVSSITLSATCGRMKVWGADDCEAGSTANAFYAGDTNELPSDLDNNVCKITVYDAVYATCTHPDWFKCNNGRCIPSNAVGTTGTPHVNNGDNDCADWSDEYCTEEWGREALCSSINGTQCNEAQGSMPHTFGGLAEYDAAAAISSVCPRTCGTCFVGEYMNTTCPKAVFFVDH